MSLESKMKLWEKSAIMEEEDQQMNSVLGTSPTLEKSSSSFLSKDYFTTIGDSDDHSMTEYGSSSNDSFSGVSEEEDPPQYETIFSYDNDRKDKDRLKNEKHHCRKEKRAQELHELCVAFLRVRKFEDLSCRIMDMGFPYIRSTMAILINKGRMDDCLSWLNREKDYSQQLLSVNFDDNTIDISDELARIIILSGTYGCSTKYVERAVVACDGDLLKAEKSLSMKKRIAAMARHHESDKSSDPILLRGLSPPSEGRCSNLSNSTLKMNDWTFNPTPLKRSVVKRMTQRKDNLLQNSIAASSDMSPKSMSTFPLTPSPLHSKSDHGTPATGEWTVNISSSSFSPSKGDGHFTTAEDPDDHSTTEYDSSSNNIFSGESEGQKEQRAQELHERCSAFLTVRKLEALSRQLVAMGFRSDRAINAVILNKGRMDECIAWLLQEEEDDGGQQVSVDLDDDICSSVDISDELVSVFVMAVDYRCPMQDVERAVVACHGDLLMAEEGLKAQKLAAAVFPTDSDEYWDPMELNGHRFIPNYILEDIAVSEPPPLPERRYSNSCKSALEMTDWSRTPAAPIERPKDTKDTLRPKDTYLPPLPGLFAGRGSPALSESSSLRDLFSIDWSLSGFGKPKRTDSMSAIWRNVLKEEDAARMPPTSPSLINGGGESYPPMGGPPAGPSDSGEWPGWSSPFEGWDLFEDVRKLVTSPWICN